MSNLADSVNEQDVGDLFSDVGPLKSHKLMEGTGEAVVVFKDRAHAQEAVERYNTVPLDNRPMKIELVGTNVATYEGGNDAQPGVLDRLKMRPPSDGGLEQGERGGARRAGRGGERGNGRGRGRGHGRGSSRSHDGGQRRTNTHDRKPAVDPATLDDDLDEYWK